MHGFTTNRTSSRNHSQVYNEALPPVQLFINMASQQPWAHLSREFERNPPMERSINASLDLVLLTQTSRDIYLIYNYLLELFTHGPILPNYIHIIYKHFHQNNIYRICNPSLFHYRWNSRFGNRIFETLEYKAPDLYRDACFQMEMEQVWV
jgi:hypothetical protein